MSEGPVTAAPARTGPARTGPAPRRLRIAITHPTCWPEVRRGSERFLHEFSHFLAERGHDVTVISTSPDGARDDYDGPVRRILLARRKRALFGPWWFGPFHRFAGQLTELLSTSDFDAVHCIHYLDAWGALRARRRGVKFRFVFQLAGIPSRRYFLAIPLDGWIFHTVVRGSDAVIAASTYALHMLQAKYGCSAQLLPPPTDTRPFDALDQSPALGGPHILFVGDADVPRKGALLLAQAFPMVRRVFPGAGLAYSGNASAATQAAIRSSLPVEMRGDVVFHGVGTVSSLPELYARATVVVNPAIWEALGMVLVEALAAGKPVVGCDHGGIPDIIDDQRIGCLFAPLSTKVAATNVTGLAEAIVSAVGLAARPETGALCRQRGRQFAWDRIGPLYEATLIGP